MLQGMVRDRQYFYINHLIAPDSYRPAQTTHEKTNTGGPLIVTQWIQMLQDHPGKSFVWYIVKCIQQRFRIGLDWCYSCYPATINLLLYSGKVWRGESLVNLENCPLFAKLKPSKLVLIINNLLADLLIRQTFFCQILENSQFAKLSPRQTFPLYGISSTRHHPRAPIKGSESQQNALLPIRI